MSGALSDLIGVGEPFFSQMIDKLEKVSNHPGIDVLLVAEISAKARTKFKELGLDPSDTKGQELYHCLQALVQKHDEFLAQVIGGKSTDEAKDLLPKIVSTVQNLPIPKQCWALKPSAAKRLIKNMPPKKAMKQLGYRSVDSMLKRENTANIFVAMLLTESPTWVNKFIATYKSLRSTDFETRSLKIVLLADQKWQTMSQEFIAAKRSNICWIREMGLVAVLPMPPKTMPGLTITVLPMLIRAVNELRIYTTYFKLHQLKPDFTKLLIAALTKNQLDIFTLADQPLHWRIIQKYYSRSGAVNTDIFEPQVSIDDLTWLAAEEQLYKLEPALKFWQDMDHIAVLQDGYVVPFGLADNAVSLLNRLDYGRQSVNNFRQALWDELLIRYLGQKQLEEQIVEQLDTKPIDGLMAQLGGAV